jgi:hypothetical protein
VASGLGASINVEVLQVTACQGSELWLFLYGILLPQMHDILLFSVSF